MFEALNAMLNRTAPFDYDKWFREATVCVVDMMKAADLLDDAELD